MLRGILAIIVALHDSFIFILPIDKVEVVFSITRWLYRPVHLRFIIASNVIGTNVSREITFCGTCFSGQTQIISRDDYLGEWEYEDRIWEKWLWMILTTKWINFTIAKLAHSG